MKKFIFIIIVLFISKTTFAQVKYTFNGNGNWNDSANWVNRLIPPTILLKGDSIVIDLTGQNECILDTIQIVSYGANLIIKPGGNLRVINDLHTFSNYSDTLTVPQDSVFAAAYSEVFQLSDIYSLNLRPSNVTSGGQYNYFIRNILQAAIDLSNTNRPDFNFTEALPHQVGLAYVCSDDNWQAKWETRFKNGSCSELLHGLECNGFVSRVLMDAGVKLNNTRLSLSELKDYHILNNVLQASPQYNNLKYMPGVLNYNLSQVKTGDIIYWSGHVGICCQKLTTGQIFVYQSNGSKTDCINNKPPNRGPRPVLLSTITGAGWGLGDYSISAIVPDAGGSTFTDARDGQVYTYKQIGSQIWMTQNLNYAAGGSVCYDNNSSNCDIYGRLYDWNTALTAAPAGWHLPSDAEWTTLSTFLGGDAVAGGAMKSTGSLWISPNIGATNSSGFEGIPGGDRYVDGQFYDIVHDGYWWSSTVSPPISARRINLHNNRVDLIRGDNEQINMFSIRCVKD